MEMDMPILMMSSLAILRNGQTMTMTVMVIIRVATTPMAALESKAFLRKTDLVALTLMLMGIPTQTHCGQ
jgi:hypothetical protein